MSAHGKWSKAFWKDLGERVGATFVGALIGTFTLTSTTPVDWSDGKAVWAVLGAPTVFSLLKGLYAQLQQSDSGASLLTGSDAPLV